MARRHLPANIHRLQKGKLYGDLRDRVVNEPKPRRLIKPRCPGYLTKTQKKEWRFFAKILDNLGLLTVANATHLELLAINMAAWRETLPKVQQTGLIIMSPNGIPMYNPYFSVLNTLEAKIMKLLDTIGLGSTGLAKLGGLVASAKKKEGTIEEFFD